MNLFAFSRARRWAAVIAFFAVATVTLANATASSAKPVHRTCGLLPGEGFYSYTKTVGITCRAAIRISLHVTRKYHGWRCRVREGYELNDVRCRRRAMRFHHESAA